MVHEQDGLDSHTRKRSYPFIHWIQTQSPEPDSKRSPEPERDSYKPPLPSPPLLSSKYISFKSGLDTFGARPGQTQHITDNNENAQYDSGKEKVQAGELLNNFRVSQTMSPCLPPNDQYSLKEGPSKRDNNSHRDVETVNRNYDAKSGFKINQKVTRQETFPSDEGQPAVKKSRPSVEISPVIAQTARRSSASPNGDMFHKTAAEIVKGRRKYSQSYDESELFSPYEATPYLPKGRKSPSRQTSPYAKKLNGPGSTHKSNGEAAKIYFQYSNENGSAFAVENCDKSDNNHNQKLISGDSLKIYSENGKSETDMTSFEHGARHDETLGARARRPNFASSIDSGIRKSVNSDLDSCHSSEAQDEVDTPSLVSKRIPDCGDRERERSRGVTLQPNLSQPRTAASAWPHRDNPDKNSSVCRSRKFNTRYPAPEKPRQKRAVIQDMVRPLKQWLLRHRHNPYPTKAEKLQLAVGSKMTLVQVSNWFANARRRLKNVVQEQRCSWSKRLRLYNQCVQGNAELLSISSDDSIWKSEDEDNGDKESGGDREEFDHEDDPGMPEADHDYSIRGTTFDPDLFGEPGQEHSEQGASSVSTNASPTSSASAGSPGLSPSPTIPDSNKYKKNMLWRYLNDVTEAHQNLSKDCKSDGESRSSLSESDVPEAVAQEIVYPPASPTAPAPASGLWEAGCSVPPASDNITISFTHSPGTSLTKTLVPVISPPSRQDLGVDKVKRHLATSGPDQVTRSPGGPSGQEGGQGYGGAQGPVLTLLPPNMRFSSAPGTSISYQLPRPSAPPTIFTPQILRPLSVLPLAGQYPFIHWNQIALPPLPNNVITSLLPLVPDSAAAVDSGAQASPGQAPPRWPGSMSGCGPRGPGAAGAALAAPAPGLSAPGWSSMTNSGPELDAAVALSQLAHSAPLPPAPSAASLP